MSSSRCGFIALVGAPNAGKSTLINYLVGEKISIISPKVQTTRHEIRGILNQNDSQIIFVDTPGIFSPSTPLERALIKNQRRAVRGADMILLIVDASKFNLRSVEQNIKIIKSKYSEIQFAIVLNKTDLLKRKEVLLEIANSLKQFNCEIFMISAVFGQGIEDIVDYILHNLPESPWFFPEEQGATDESIENRLSEITREKIYETLDQELPYSIKINNEQVRITDRKIKLFQSIVVKKESQKKIVIGRNGQKIQDIKRRAIQEMRTIFNKTVDLRLTVIVRENWDQNL